MGYFGDFGIVAKGSCVEEALEAFTHLSTILGFDLEAGKSENRSEI